jgi:hypothetical protein
MPAQRIMFRTIWKLVTLLFTLVTCLLAQGTPALAISTSSYFAGASVGFDGCPTFLEAGAGRPNAFPAGTGVTVTLASGSRFTPPPILAGDASASSGVGWNPNSPPFPSGSIGSISAGAGGIATTPPGSFASSFASGVFGGARAAVPLVPARTDVGLVPPGEGTVRGRCGVRVLFNPER